MSDRAYFYFKDLYSQSTEYIICIDENLKVIYMSDAFRHRFELSPNDNSLLNCFISKRYAVAIQKATCESKSISFDYIHPSDKELRHCMVIPHTVYSIKYSTLIISELSKTSYNAKRLEQIGLQIDNAEDTVHDKIALINSLTGYLKEHPERITEISNKIINASVNIRREFDNIAIVSRGKPSNHKVSPCNVTQFIEFFAKLTVSMIGFNRIRFDLDFSDIAILTMTSYEILDYLFSSIVCHLLSGTKGLMTIHVASYYSEAENILIFSNYEDSINGIDEIIKSNAQVVDEDIPIVSRLIEHNGGRVIAILNNTRGKAVALAFERCKDRRLIVREQEAPDANIEKHINILSSQYASETDVIYNYKNYYSGGIK